MPHNAWHPSPASPDARARTRSTLFRLALAASLTGVIAGCAAPLSTTGSPSSLRVLADTALGDLPPSLTNAYEAQAGLGSVTYAQAERSQILDSLRTGEADAVFLMHPTDDRTMFVTAVGYQTLLVVTASDLAVDDLSETDLQAVFAGRITNWADVGGPDLPVQPVVPFSGTSQRAAFESAIMRGQPISSSALLASQKSQLLALVRSAGGRISFLVGDVPPEGMKAISIGGVRAPGISGPRGAYPLVASVVFASPQEPEGDTKLFLDWVLSQDGQAIVSRYTIALD